MCMSSGPKASAPPPPPPAAPVVLEQAAPDKAVKKAKLGKDKAGNKSYRNNYTPSAATGVGGVPTAGKNLSISKK